LLTHGATNHGVQRAAGNGTMKQRLDPVSYYSRRGPAGDIIAAARAKKPDLRVAVIGLGAGGVAGYIERGQEWTFYEIDPEVAAIARDSQLFTFWNAAPTPPRLILGDARLQLKTAPRGHYDLILLDAYSSDTVPVHLLTREALAIYRDKLAPGGLIGWHISNAHFDLEPVVGQLAKDAKMASLTRRDTDVPPAALEQRIAPSQWAVLGAKPADLSAMRQHSTWKTMRLDAPLWSDEKSSLWSLMVRKWASK
jgi:spermidine synthase